MCLISNQRFSSQLLKHKFNKIEDINIEDLKVRPKTKQTGTCLNNASKVIANYLKPLAKNDHYH